MGDKDHPHPTIIPTGMADPEYRRKRRAARKPFNFELDKTRREQLEQVAMARGISQAATLRQLITAAFAMDVKNDPMCASGRKCFMPHVHPQPQKAPSHDDPV